MFFAVKNFPAISGVFYCLDPNHNIPPSALAALATEIAQNHMFLLSVVAKSSTTTRVPGLGHDPRPLIAEICC